MVADLCSEPLPSSAHWDWPWRNLWSLTWCLLGRSEEPTSGRIGGLELQNGQTSVSTAVFWPEYCSVRSTGTWLVVHGGYVNLKGSNVGHQEGQSPPVDHLRGVDITGVHFGHAPCLSPWQQQETAQTQVQLTLISMTLSKRICGFSWNSNWKFWKRIAGKHLYYTSLYCTLLYSTVFYCILVYSSLPYLIVEGAVGGFLCRCVFFLISHSDENCWVDVHSNELLSLVDVHIHLHTQQRTGIEQTTNP